MSDYEQSVNEVFVDGTVSPSVDKWLWWVNQADHSQRVQGLALYNSSYAGEGIEISDVDGRVVFVAKDNIQYLEIALANAKTSLGI